MVRVRAQVRVQVRVQEQAVLAVHPGLAGHREDKKITKEDILCQVEIEVDQQEWGL
ncbi:MAG: hypothetical protein U9P80_07150 [Thermodesulfobacteriota bacterium]|nr:hypothetical protein [Thermodesulfobacteriota bacterium]